MKNSERIALWFVVILALIGPPLALKAQFTFNRSDGTFAPVGPDGMGGTNGAAIVPQGRLTLTTGAPITGNVTGATTVYWTPYKGNGVPIYNGTSWQSYAVTSDLSNVLSNATTNPAATIANASYDLFIWNNAGTLTLSRGPPWPSQFVRNLTLTLINGIYVNSAAITNGPATDQGTWVGTMTTNGSNQIDFIPSATAASGGGTCRVYLYNFWQQNLTRSSNIDNGGGYSYGTSAYRQARASANNTCAILIGDPNGAVVHATIWEQTTAAAVAGNEMFIGIGVDITNNATTPTLSFVEEEVALGATYFQKATGHFFVSQGPHLFNAVEDTSGTNTFGVSGPQINTAHLQ